MIKTPCSTCKYYNQDLVTVDHIDYIHSCKKDEYFIMEELPDGRAPSAKIENKVYYTNFHLIEFWANKTICFQKYIIFLSTVAPLIISLIALAFSIWALFNNK